MSLKIKFTILALLFTGVMAMSLMIQAFSAEEIARKVKRLEETETEKYLTAQEMLSSFRLIDYSFEIAVLTGEPTLFENAEAEKTSFLRQLEVYKTIGNETEDELPGLEDEFNRYFQQSLSLAQMIISEDSFSADNSGNIQFEIETLSRKNAADRELLHKHLETNKRAKRASLSNTLYEIRKNSEEKLVQNSLLAVAVTLVLMLLIFLIYKAIIRPVSYLSRMTDYVSRGEYSRVNKDKTQGHGEIEALLDSFIRMTRNLELTTVSRDYFNTIIQNSADMVFVLNTELRVEFFNSSTLEATAYQEQQLSGQHFSELADPVWYRKSQFINSEGAEIRYDHEECRIVSSDGSSFPVLFSCSPLKDSDGKVTSHVCIASDISDRVEAEKALKDAEYEARQKQLLQKDKMETLSILVAGVAHEINNPNHVIASNNVFLRKSWESAIVIFEKFYTENGSFALGGIPYEKAREYIPQLMELIQGGSERIKNIVKELRDYARVEPAEITEEVSLNAVVKSAATLMSNIISKSSSDFSLVLDKDLPPVRGNYQKLEQVLINLIANSCQAMKERQGKLLITTAFEEENHRVNVKIEDQGKGMDDEIMRHIFDPFYTTRRDEGGTGLGLSISQTIIKEHNGKLSFKSEENRGTVAEILIPASAEKDH